jgi:2-hydroxychromene-2-carboxylate isomerase
MTTELSRGSLLIDLFWSFRSPYSYLATPRLVALAAEYALEITVRPVRPIAVRDPQFFSRANPLWAPYLLRDTRRIAEFLGLDFGWPRPDPVVQDYANRRIPQEQPYIHRLTRLGAEAARRGKGLAFLDEVSRVIWGGRVVGWHEGAHLAEAARRAGLDLTELDAAIGAHEVELDATIEGNEKALEAAGHWGVPTMVFQGEPFFGQDRIDLLVWRLKQHGLRRRKSPLKGDR